MFGLGLPEIIVIALVIILLFFGSGKISGFGRALGRFSGEFKKGKKEIEKELQETNKDEGQNS